MFFFFYSQTQLLVLPSTQAPTLSHIHSKPNHGDLKILSPQYFLTLSSNPEYCHHYLSRIKVLLPLMDYGNNLLPSYYDNNLLPSYSASNIVP